MQGNAMQRRVPGESAEALRDMAVPGASRLTLQSLRVARTFVTESRLSQWVAERNRTAGLPVRTPVLLERYSAMVAAAVHDEHLAPSLPRGPPMEGREMARACFVYRWRTRTGAKWRRLRTRDPITLAEKAGQGDRFKN